MLYYFPVPLQWVSGLSAAAGCDEGRRPLCYASVLLRHPNRPYPNHRQPTRQKKTLREISVSMRVMDSTAGM
jgi:hypothetical protein